MLTQGRSSADHEVLARSAILNVISRGALVFVAGILVWGFNKIDSSLDRLNESLKEVQISISRLEMERDSIKERLSVLDARLANKWEASRTTADK